jgi:hypothetical protein
MALISARPAKPKVRLMAALTVSSPEAATDSKRCAADIGIGNPSRQ